MGVHSSSTAECKLFENHAFSCAASMH